MKKYKPSFNKPSAKDDQGVRAKKHLGQHFLTDENIASKIADTLSYEGYDKVLEIGTGSGYQTAVLLKLKAKVYTIERQSVLFKKANLCFRKMGYRPRKLIFGDGYKGLPEEAPFDGIFVTAGAPEVPKALLGQLKVGGRLVIPVGFEEQIMTLFVRKSEKEFEKEEFGSFRFVPLLGDKT